jgi:glutathione S-transferase
VLKRSDYPRLDALYRRLQQDPAVQFAHAIEAQQPVQGSGALVDQLSLEQALELLPAGR